MYIQVVIDHSKYQCFIWISIKSTIYQLERGYTTKLNKRLVDCTTVLPNKHMLATLSNGDVQEIMCHMSCFAAVTEREQIRDIQRPRTVILAFAFDNNGAMHMAKTAAMIRDA